MIGSLTCGSWESGPVRLAAGFLDRWRGLRPRPRTCGLLLRARSVHGIGMREDLWAVGISSAGVVLTVKRLRAGSIAILPGATWVLELPLGRRPPPPGSALSWDRCRAA
jgi:hypothetical protein